jgi:lipopolysaccharide/colanic/teichoic acid biosynthesis glycosyltransferase
MVEPATGIPRDGIPFDSFGARAGKRAMDLMLAISIGAFVLPLLVVIAVAIKCASRGPVFYGQVRVGRRGNPFRVWKFRTMVEGAEHRLDEYLGAHPELHQEWTRKFKLEDDPRVIPRIGSLLRKTGLDELPQLWNVLVAEMSMVGPRPLPQYHLAEFDVDFRELRTMMPPGITGQWQVHGQNLGEPECIAKWDCDYIRNWSLWLDLQILLQTPQVMFLRHRTATSRDARSISDHPRKESSHSD